jgi:hypothetical protein
VDPTKESGYRAISLLNALLKIPLLHKESVSFDVKSMAVLWPLEVFHGDNTQEAFRFMQPGQHIGRVCLLLRKYFQKSLDLTVTPGSKTLELYSCGSYLLAGGLSGIGRSISRWMVENDARHLT